MSNRGCFPPENLLKTYGAVDCASRGSGVCNRAKPPRHWFFRMKIQPVEAQGSLASRWLRPQTLLCDFS